MLLIFGCKMFASGWLLPEDEWQQQQDEQLDRQDHDQDQEHQQDHQQEQQQEQEQAARVPTLWVNSLDDPLISAELIPLRGFRSLPNTFLGALSALLSSLCRSVSHGIIRLQLCCLLSDAVWLPRVASADGGGRALRVLAGGALRAATAGRAELGGGERLGVSGGCTGAAGRGRDSLHEHLDCCD